MLDYFKRVDKNVLLLSVSTLLSQAIPLLFSPLLTRLFTPGEFGDFGVYFSLVMILGVFATGRYESAIVLPSDTKDSKSLTILVVLLSSASLIFLYIPILLFKKEIASILNIQSYSVLYFVPLGIWMISVNQALNYYLNKVGNYKSISFSRIIRSLGTSFGSVLLGSFSILKSFGLALGDIIGLSFSIIQMYVKILKSEKSFASNIDLNKLKDLAKKYKHFPLFNVPSGILEKSSSHMPSILLGSLYSQQIVGFFTLSQRIVGAPGSIIARSYGDVFRQKANEQYSKTGECREEFNKTFKSLLKISIIPFLILFFIAPYTFNLVFGQNWFEAGNYTKYLCIMYFLQFITSPLSNMFYIAEKQKLDFIIQAILFTLLVIGIYFSKYLWNNPKYTIIMYSIIYSLKYIFELWISYTLSRNAKPNESEHT